MTSVDAISGEELPVCLDSFETSAPIHEEAVTCYQCPGPNSGLIRMRDEQSLLATTYQLQDTLTLQERCQKIYNLISTLCLEGGGMFDWHLFNLIEELSALDPHLALQYILKLSCEDDRLYLWLEVIKELNDNEAHQNLQKIKESITTYEPHVLYFIYEEENRRGFFEAQSTLETLLARNYTTCHGLTVQAHALASAGRRNEAEQTLAKAFAIHQTPPSPLRDVLQSEQMQYWDKEADLYGMLYVAIENELPQLQDILQAYREHVLKAPYSDGMMYMFSDIIELELEHPNLNLLDQEVQNIVKAFHALDPYDAEDLERELTYIFNVLLPERVDLAKEILQIIPKGYFETRSHIQLYGHSKEGNLEQLIQKATADSYCDELFLDLFVAVEKQEGVNAALPYLERAKAGAEDDWDLLDVLEIEVQYGLPTKETLGRIHEYLKYYPDPNTLLDIEFIFAFAKGKEA